MDGRLLTGVTVLDAVIESGGFSRAGDALGISPSGVSHAIARLEARLGVRLLDRTTRAISLTDEGRRFYERVRPSLDEIEEAAIDASGAAAKVRGRLRINIDPLFSRLVLAGHLGHFLQQHPELGLETITREHIGDLVADGVDVAVRFGEPQGSSLISRRLADIRVLTVATPEYLKRHGRPTIPQDLSKHACIDFRDPQTGRPYDWEFHRKRKVLAVKISSRLLLSHAHRVSGRHRYLSGSGDRRKGSARRGPPGESVSGLARRDLSALRFISVTSSSAGESARLHRIRSSARALRRSRGR